MTQIILLIMWGIGVVVFAIINALLGKHMKGISSLRPFAKWMYYVEVGVGTFFLLLALMFLINFSFSGGGTTPTMGTNSIVY